MANKNGVPENLKAGNIGEIRRAQLESQKQEVKDVVPVMQITTISEAKSEETIGYVIKRLEDGISWGVIKKELGLHEYKNSSLWHEIKKIVISNFLPMNEKEALLRSHQEMAFWVQKYEEMIEDVDDKINKCIEVSSRYNERRKQEEIIESGMLPNLMKLKKEIIDKMIENKAKYFDDFMKIKQLRQRERQNQGPSILIMNNIPRPENRAQELKDVLIESVSKIESINDDE